MKSITKHKQKLFVPICHYCHIPGQIRPWCYKYQNTLNRGMQFYSPNNGKQKKFPRTKIDLTDRKTRKIWVRKSDMQSQMAQLLSSSPVPSSSAVDPPV